LDHESEFRPFFDKWGEVFDQYINNMPAGFTFNYYFEIKQGEVTYRHLATTPDSEAQTVNLLKGDVDLMRRGLLNELFGVSDASELSLESLNTLRLPRTPRKQLTSKKLASLFEKYFSIPPEFLSYYPGGDSWREDKGTDNGEGAADEGDDEPADADEQRKKKPKTTIAVGARKPGRPKHSSKVKMVENGQNSILTYLKSKSNSGNSGNSSSSSST
jgi:hypothetical protein